MPKEKERIDTLITGRGLAPSRERAQALVLSGKVLANGVRAEKPGQKIPIDSDIEIIAPDHPYVSRGGVKLAGALDFFKIDAAGKTTLDIGCSTGGFTDCLLQRGAARVFALDVGKGVLDYKLRIDPRVKVIEGLNARFLQFEDIGGEVDIAVVDVAFISLTLIIPQVYPLVRTGGVFVPLVKPQFEVGRDEVEKGGIIRSLEKHIAVLEKITAAGVSAGFACKAVTHSLIEGSKGNREYFLLFEKTGTPENLLSTESINMAVYNIDK